MSQKCIHEINVENIFHLLSSHFKVTYDDLLNVLREETNYKRLLGIGEKQFFDAPTESSIEAESQKSRLCFAKINLLAVEVDNDIDRIIQEKLQGDFLSTLKEKVLEAILELSSKQKCSTELPLSARSPVKRKKNEEKAVLEKIKDLSKYCAENINDIRKQVSEMPVEDTEDTDENKKALSSVIRKEEMDIDNNDDLGNISFESISSVHTSDLSSFEDEINLSSDEESGIKGKRLSLKAVQEKVEEIKAKRLGVTKDKRQVQSSQTISQSKSPLNEGYSALQKSQRVRKPNLKYAADDMVSTFKRKSINESSNLSTSSSTRAVDSDVPRKRGRPRKDLT